MDTNQMISMIFSIVGGLGVFLLGMRNMSDGLQAVAGNHLRKLIGIVTNNRLLATGVGTLVTCVIQSSSVTTVMTVGFVNSGLMTLQQAIGVIMGANIGTTITGWILVLSVDQYGLPLLGITAFIFLFSRKEKIRYFGMTLMGVGMIFFGLQLMKDGFKPIRDIPQFVEWFHAFSANTYFGVLKCALVGCVLTLVVQSSSATLGITMGLASTGVINFETAAALVLGENIGTTITAFLASLGTTTNAKRAAYAHIVFNVLGVLWVTAIFGFYIAIIRKIVMVDPNTAVTVGGEITYPYVQSGIAAVHTVFNIANTVLFIPLVPLLAKALVRFIPDKPYKEPPKLTHLDVFMLDTPTIGIEQARKEIIIMSEHDRKMLDKLKEVLQQEKPDQDLVKKIFDGEETQDIMQKEITVFLTDLLSGEVPHSLSDYARRQMRLADEYESVSDYVASILKLYLKIINAGIVMREPMKKDILELHDMVSSYFDFVNKAYLNLDRTVTKSAYPMGDQITHCFREFRSRHLIRLSESRFEPLLCTAYSDMLTGYRRVKDHLINIAEVISGEK